MVSVKLCESEIVTTYLEEVLKREKKIMKRLVDWEKQKTKMLEEIEAEKQKMSEMLRQMVDMEASVKDAEAKWREEKKAKELAAAQVESLRLKLLDEMDNLEDSSDNQSGNNRECVICLEYKVSVLFLPCAHQVLCVNCNEEHAKKGKETCPCCRVPIEQRIRVFGA